jgi:DNA-binding MarR family transcriptional regulator
MAAEADTGRVASDLRLVIGQLVRRLRAEHRFPLAQGTVLGRLDREGAQSVSDLAAKERVRHQSMTQTVRDLEADGFVERRPDPQDRRRALVDLTDAGRAALEEDRRHRVGWLAGAIDERLTARERRVLEEATDLLRRLSDA